MNFVLSGEQLLLRRSVQAFLDRQPAHEEAATRWRRCAVELGVMAIGLPEPCGGAPGGAIEQLVVMETLGETAANLPFLESAIVAGSLVRAQDPRNFGAPMAAMAAGAMIPVPAWTLGYRYRSGEPPVKASRVGDRWQLSGLEPMVLAASIATHFIIVAEGADGDGSGIFLIDRKADGLVLDCFETLDDRGMGSVRLDGVLSNEADRLAGSSSVPDLLDRAEDEGIAAASAEALGLCAAMLGQTIRYIAQRRQFGRRLADFQVLQHRIADMHLHIEQLRSAMWLAVSSLEEPAASRSRAASIAKIAADNACRFVSHNAVQLHGGIGVTDELPLARYVRRALVLTLCLGGTDRHRTRLAELCREELAE